MQAVAILPPASRMISAIFSPSFRATQICAARSQPRWQSCGFLPGNHPAVERASKLTRQLLAFSRKQIIQLQTVDLNDLITQLSSMLTRLIGENIDFKCHYDPQLPALEADACSIEQVVMNLVVNARDAMPNGGKLTITTGAISIDQLIR